MRKMMMLAALLAMLVVAAIPAIAQVEQPFEQEADSGDVDQSFSVTGGGDNGEGDNSNQCVNVTGNTNTGNLQTQTGILQYDSEIEEFEQDEVGDNLTVGSEEGSTVTCDTQVNQAASAG
jgi:ABC-type oligopeptide transport system substrate-binding subunit